MRSNKTSRHAHGSNILRKSRRGESTIIANLILFIAVMGMAGATAAVFKSMLEEGTNAAASEKTRAVNVIDTDFTIPSAAYAGGQVTVYVKNTGKASFDPEEMDLYIDGLRIPRDPANRSVSVTSDTDLSNIGTWDSGEELEFAVYQTYSVPTSHNLAVVASNGARADAVFSS